MVTAIDVLTNRKAQLVAARPVLNPNQITAREQAIINCKIMYMGCKTLYQLVAKGWAILM